ncbi:ubiquinone biosynthesis O-methyltransferase, mitochondrial [Cryptotermes secundus]|uniref:ubiquinone biosynthesis O-methyltransferase, mitochondrial n=1 Tax=Cryptotermes secundus TaxID=105785 RepID=UPI000CD7D85F|nr:ubiquinone biosynthesis O-methyltransferase, mitochondrial [Cryptotermes secundus]XP_033611648.1 ubiquinone biosynthesis O-methyltransferase, mitochondrial [Cryptotermes secundus]XP_033611649.1 ubiquinone biosynthesis O-methyltransferase, mitochondrial [Cryptotermes secundus]XP_033611650.1 ubiquinone biosynthesis O-methyltransferase, mitochondrial [Cryptotermes secundus]XP_033611651.1 ubiquinone biosynthesis O-methyltransferase, mitochondrial [Cryptotermes secundus]XP_033611652.1 ubiquinone
MNAHDFSRILQGRMCQIPALFCKFRSTACLKQKVQQHEQSTVDERDVAHFSKLSSGWWDEQGEMKALHALNKLRVPLIRDGLRNVGQIDLSKWQSPKPLHGMKILEVGCGGGILTEPLARIGADITGIDASQNVIDIASSHAQQDPSVSNSITYTCRTVEEHAKEHKDFYDAVVATEVLEHVTHKDLFLEACISTLKPGGSVFITTLNRTVVLWAFGIMLAEYVLGIIPRGTHQLEKCIKPHETQALLEKYGCTTKLIHGMLYNLLSNEWHWSSNTSMNYALHAVRKQQ